ncbi:MAG: SDR family oxidoreductase [Acidimicrobiia bacterium]
MSLLDGKVAIVTGAGRGIGRSEAMLLASHGARVVVNDFGGPLRTDGEQDSGPAHSVVEEIRAAGGEAVANVSDVSDWNGAKGLVAQAIDTFGSLDIVVNNAGVVREAMSFNLDEADWDIVIRVHLKGTFGTIRFAGEYWRDRAKATGKPVDAAIVNTSSVNGLNGGMPGHVNYAVAKSAIATMTITIARELAKYGVRCNAIAPVAFTRMTESLWGGELFSDERREELGPEGVAAVAGWLASPLSSHVNGQIIAVHGHQSYVWSGWTPSNPINTSGAWTLDSFDAAAAGLFVDRDPGVPQPGSGEA